MVDSFHLPACFRRVLTDIAQCDFARLELVIRNCEEQVSAAPAPPRPALLRRLRAMRDAHYRRHLLYSAYQRYDACHAGDPDPIAEVDCADILGAVPRLDVVPLRKRFVHRFHDADVDELKAHNLDVILRFGFNILRGEVLSSARYGIWSYHHGDNDYYRGGPALFWEIVEKAPASGVILQVLTQKLDDGFVLCKSLFPTALGLSRNRNVYCPYWGSAHFVIRKLHELHERGWDSLRQNAIPPAPFKGRRELYRAPTNADLVKWLTPAIARKAVLRPFSEPKRFHWRIALWQSSSPRISPGSRAGLGQPVYVPSPPGRFYADPFLVEGDRGQLWLFFEDFSYAEERARISVVPIGSGLSIGQPIECLNLPYHVSYPFVFRHDGEIFLIPESAMNGTVELWRATGFPASWKLEKTLYHGQAVDTTAVRADDGLWYFFTALFDGPGYPAYGALFTAESLTSEWKLHPGSPLSTDVHYLRSGGPLVTEGGRLLRPVQDGTGNYGRRLHFLEVTELSPSTYRDRLAHTIEADWSPKLTGTHAYTFAAGVEAMDCVYFAPALRVDAGKA